MTSLTDKILSGSELLIYAVLAASAWREWRRRSGPAVWLVLTFGSLAGVVAIALVIPQLPSGAAALWVTKALVAALFVFPYGLYRFSSYFARPAPRFDRAAAAATIIIVGLSAAIPRLVPVSESRPAWALGYGIAFVTFWGALTAVAVQRLWRTDVDHSSLARNRMRLMAGGLVLLTLSLAVGVASAKPRGASLVVEESMALLSALLLFGGYRVPSVLRNRWRRSEMAAFIAAEGKIATAESVAQLSSHFLPWVTRLLGGNDALLVDAGNEVLAASNISPEAIRARLAELPPPGSAQSFETTDLVAHCTRSGWLVVGLSVASPLLGREELALLSRLASTADLFLDFIGLLEVERSARSDLAEAQELARIGSWRWVFVDDQIVVSREMSRLLGRSPSAGVLGYRELAGHVHPTDRDLFVRLCATARDRAESFSLVHRVEGPAGSVRYLRTEARVARDSADRPVELKATSQDITGQKQAEDALAHSAFHDALTGLPNRRLFLDRLEQAVLHRQRIPSRLGVFFVDLDRFKVINDSLGHSAGDRLLVTVAHRLQSAARSSDTVARFGGDEFLVLCQDLADEEEALGVADRLRQAIAQPCWLDGAETTPTASVGLVVTAPSGSLDAEALVRDADTAMYQAKNRGSDAVAVFTPDLRTRARKRLGLESDLRRALQAGQMEVHYQPELDLATGELAGMEALVRWRHPDRGVVLPSEFIGLAEETGLIVPLGAGVLASACREAAELAPGPFGALTVAVNLSGRQLLEPQLGQVIRQMLLASNLPPSRLRLEITESVLLGDEDGIGQVLSELKDLGVQIAVDDFGTGYSSLTYLKRFPVDVLKIDASFVRGVADNREDHAIVASVIDLAHALGLVTTAEGIETAAQLDRLRRMGCALGQGFYWSPAVPPDQIPEWAKLNDVQRPDERGCPGAPSVLVVDDERSLRGLMRRLLDDSGRFRVHEASDGREAIALARRYQPDLVLLDLAMPEMGGIDALPVIRAVAPATRVVVLSGLDSVEAAASAAHGGAVAFIEKGTDLAGLPERLESLLAV